MRKKVLVTGGARGLGRALVWEFARDGYDVVYTYLKSEDEAFELQESVKKECRVEVDIFKVDLANEDEILKFAKEVGEIDVLVNNAAYNDDGDIFSKTKDSFMKIYAINVVAPFLLTKAFGDILMRKNGNIVNIVSTNAIDTMYPEGADYDASKAALLNLSKNLAVAFRGKVRVNAVAPGWIDTENTMDMEPKMRKREENKILMGRFAKPVEVAKLVHFVASCEASYINGEVIRVDGGISDGCRETHIGS